MLNQVEYVVLGEADRMLDIGFLPDLQRILSYLPGSAPRCSSAPFSPEIKRLASSYLQNPITIRSGPPERDGLLRWSSAFTAQAMMTSAAPSTRCSKPVASSRRSFCEQQGLWPPGPQPGARRPQDRSLHGDKSQDERLKALEAFKQGEVDLLVCTDVAARGLDIKDALPCSTSMCPSMPKTTCTALAAPAARAPRLAVTLVSGSDARLVGDIEKLIKKKIELEAIEYDDDRPKERINDGRRAWREGAGFERPAQRRLCPPPRGRANP